MTEYTSEFFARFWSHIDRKDDPDACWNWIAGRMRGYGRLRRGNRMVLAHRVSYEISRDDPGNLDVLHTCDNPSCCNPNHLFLGTPLDNARDRERKNRGNHPSGEHHKSSKLSDLQVAEIRQLYAKGDITLAKLGEQFGVHLSQIWSIVRYKQRK